MDAVEYLKERRRMCYSSATCGSCRLRAEAARAHETCGEYVENHPAEAVEIVERWAREHPRKTRQSELLKLFPRVDKALDGVVAFCPENMDSEFECALKRGSGRDQCTGCRRKYWLEEVEEDGD